MPPPALPVTVLTGFLGSGKTTLVNRVLTADHGRRIVVIENELGSVSIDHALIDEARQKDAPHGVIVLKNGCMCCTTVKCGHNQPVIAAQSKLVAIVNG